MKNFFNFVFLRYNSCGMIEARTRKEQLNCLFEQEQHDKKTAQTGGIFYFNHNCALTS